MENFTNIFQNTNPGQDYELAPLNDLSCIEQHQQPTGQGFLFDYVHFPLQLYLLETKDKGGTVQQQIQDGLLSFVLDFHSVENRNNFYMITVLVSYTNKTNTSRRNSMEVSNLGISHIQETKTLVTVDLNSVQVHPDNRLYDLGRNMQDVFHLDVSLELSNGSIIQQRTRSFSIVGRKMYSSIGDKRQSSEESADSGIGSYGRPSVSSQNSLYVNRTPPTTAEFDTELVEARRVVAEHIKTRTAVVTDRLVAKTITSPNGDIAYHFTLHDDDDNFEEGEVVGFLGAEDGESFKLCKLTPELSSCAILKGVVSRSQYFEAQKPDPGMRSETVAMLGIVPVQVVGPVCANEALYASPTHPGCAVSGSALDSSLLNEVAFIGYAFSTRKTEDEQSLGMVQAAVSVLQSAGFKLHADKIRRLEQQVDEKIIKIRRFGKRTRQYIGIGTFAFFILLLLGGILAWQLLEPGTALRYMRCSTGRKVPHAQATFAMNPYTTPQLTAIVNGIEFDFPALMEKANHNYQRLGLKGERYYLNIDRCAYGYVSRGDVARGIKPVRGPTVFVIDEQCFRVYYYSETSQRWKKYNSSSWKHYGNICCEPESIWKNCTELRESKFCSKFSGSAVQNCFS